MPNLLVRLQRMARIAQNAASHAPQAHTQAAQTESVRKMLLAFSRDLRVVLLRLAGARRAGPVRFCGAGMVSRAVAIPLGEL